MRYEWNRCHSVQCVLDMLDELKRIMRSVAQRQVT